MSIDTTTTAGKIAVMQAFEAGKTVESADLHPWSGTKISDWLPDLTPHWDWQRKDYRIAPEPPKKRLVPWKVSVELLGKRLKARDGSDVLMITRVDLDGGDWPIRSGSTAHFSPEFLAEHYVELLPDGTEAPCGTEEEVQA